MFNDPRRTVEGAHDEHTQPPDGPRPPGHSAQLIVRPRLISGKAHYGWWRWMTEPQCGRQSWGQGPPHDWRHIGEHFGADQAG
jgi:hypothetical protein